MRTLIVGCGYVGSEFANYAGCAGHEVHATTRSHSTANSLADRNIIPVVYDWLEVAPLPTTGRFDNVVIAVSHASVPGLPPQLTHVRGLTNLFANGTDWFDRCLYLSTTGVFRGTDGELLDESSPTDPKRPGSIAALAAEDWLRENMPERKFTILRLAGIYGPGRIPNLEKLRTEPTIDADPDSYLNLIHVEDIASILLRCIESNSCSSLYCVSDGNPVRRGDYYAQICSWLGVPVPKMQPNPKPTNDMATPKRGSDNKRIVNAKLLRELHIQLRYPSFVEGLRPLLA